MHCIISILLWQKWISPILLRFGASCTIQSSTLTTSWSRRGRERERERKGWPCLAPGCHLQWLVKGAKLRPFKLCRTDWDFMFIKPVSLDILIICFSNKNQNSLSRSNPPHSHISKQWREMRQIEIFYGPPWFNLLT